MLDSRESFDSNQSTLPFSQSQRSIETTLSQAQEQPSYSDRGWESIFPELIGISPDNDKDVPADENTHYLDFGNLFFPADANGANIESWSSQELSDGSQVHNGHSVSVGPAEDDLSNQDWICYGMVGCLSISTVATAIRRPRSQLADSVVTVACISPADMLINRSIELGLSSLVTCRR